MLLYLIDMHLLVVIIWYEMLFKIMTCFMSLFVLS